MNAILKPSKTERDVRIERQAAEWFARMRSHNHTLQDSVSFTDWLAEDEEHSKVYMEIEFLWDLLGKFADRPEVKALIQETSRDRNPEKQGEPQMDTDGHRLRE